MHEFSLAQNIIEIVDDIVRQNKITQVTEIVLEIGTLAGVEIPALDMALESLQPNSTLRNASIQKQIIQALASCKGCNHEFEPDDFFTACPICGSFSLDIKQGKEFKVKTITGE